MSTTPILRQLNLPVNINGGISTVTYNLGDINMDAEITTRSTLGAHNLLNTKNYEGIYPPGRNGLTTTKNADGTYTISGTHTLKSGTTGFRCYGNILDAGNYVYSLGVNALGSSLVIANDSPNSLGNYKIIGTISQGSQYCTFTYSDADKATYPYIVCEIGIYQNQVNVNTTFKPMLRLATDTDATYRPYAKTNKELTDDVSSIKSTVVTQVKVGTTAYDPTNGVVSLPAYPTTLPASDVSSWAKASTKPTYTASEVGAATSGHTHTTSLATSSGTNQITLAANTKYSLGAGGTSVIFTTPPDTNTWRGIQNNLTSDSTTDSLSAKQGKALNTRLTSLEGVVGDANTLLEGV